MAKPRTMLRIYILSYLTVSLIAKGLVKSNHKNLKFKSEPVKGVYLNKWAVVVHGDDDMANLVAAENGFANTGKVFGNVYKFIHGGIPKRRKRASFVKSIHLRSDTRVIFAEQQESKARTKRSIIFNDGEFENQWYLHRNDFGFAHHHMNVLPVWKKGYTGKGVVVAVLDDGLEHTHPEIQPNYDPEASFDYNNNDTDPLPRYNWREDNKHGTRCAGEIAAAGNNSFCIVGVAYGASIGGIRMLDGEITDLVEAQSLRHARHHIDIYSSSWGPEDDGITVDGPGLLTKKALEDGARFGRKGKGSIVVWASGNGGENDHCNCDGYTNSIYTIAVSAATSIGLRPWYLESCASTLVSAYSTGSTEFEKSMVTADLNGGCTDQHTGTSASQPLVTGFVALALEANPNLTWRDVQHILVESSSLEHLEGNDFHVNGAGKKFSHHFGYGIVNGEILINHAEKWPTAPEQRKCLHSKEIQRFPHNRFNKSHALELAINTKACKGTPNFIQYVEHVVVKTTFYHYRRGATEILIVSPSGTQSWVLKEREKDIRGGEFHEWDFLSTHFWGENPSGKWRIIFYSKEVDEFKQGFLQDMTLVIYGTESKPGEKMQNFKCHAQCKKGCTGIANHQCNKCRNKYYIGENGEKHCIEACSSNKFLHTNKLECVACDKSCLTCVGPAQSECLSCKPALVLYHGECLESCPKGMFQEVDNKKSECVKCAARCTSCVGKADNCSECGTGSILQHSACLAKCSNNEWLNGEVCELCHLSCKSCTGGASEYNCTVCPKISLNDFENRYLYESSQCLKSCPIRTFKESTIEEDCLACPDNCLQCSNDGYKCEVCDVSHFRVAAGDGKCVKECPKGYYADILRRVCEPCDIQCSKCVPGNPSACIACMDGFYLKDHECVSTSECQTRYYVNKTTGTCDLCPATCSFCESASKCTACFLNYYLTPDEKCVEKCPNGTYAVDRRTMCGKCSSTCSECEGATSHDCTACALGKYLHNGKCVKKIRKGYYAEHVDNTMVTKPCHYTCSECTGPLPLDCITCIEPLDKRENGCINPCPNQWLSENKCENCNPSCQSCFGPQSDQCLDCSGNFSLNIDTHTCNKACPRKYYKDPKTFICKRCHHSCASCNGPKLNQCLTCPDKFQFHNNTCVWQCPFGWYKTFEQQCARCSPRCKKCLYKYDLCTNCHQGFVWKDFKCFKSCGEKMFHDESKRCYLCHESCQTCNGTSPNQCTSCGEGMTLYKDMCVAGCLTGYYNSTIEKKCTPCMKDCLKCYESVNNQLKCAICSNSTVLSPDGHCLSTCPGGTFDYKLDNKCGQCPGKGCLRCDQKTCHKCQPLFEPSNGLCKSTCGKGMFPDEKSKQCKNCHENCLSCHGSSPHECERCTNDVLTLIHDTKQISCLKSCPDGYFKHKKLCKPCKAPCETCTSKTQCSSCIPSFYTFNDSCVKLCPPGFYQSLDNTTCISCDSFSTGCNACNETMCYDCEKNFFLKEGKCVKKCDLGFFAVNATCLQCTLNHSNCSQCNITTCFECEAKFKLINNVCNEECDTGSKKINGTCKLCVSPTCSENAEIILVEKEREDIQVIPLKSEITVEEEEAKQFDHTSKLVESLQETLANFTRNTKLVEAEFSNNKRSKRSIELENTNSNDHYKTNISFLSKMITILACFVSVAFILFIAWRSKGFSGKLIRGKRSLVLHYNTTEEIWTENKP